MLCWRVIVLDCCKYSYLYHYTLGAAGSALPRSPRGFHIHLLGTARCSDLQQDRMGRLLLD